VGRLNFVLVVWSWFWFRARIVCKLSQKKCIKVNKSANKCKKVVGFAVQVCSVFCNLSVFLGSSRTFEASVIARSKAVVG
jgi:hypothetical protein